MGGEVIQNVNGLYGLDLAAIMGAVKNRTIHNVYFEKTAFTQNSAEYKNFNELTEEKYWIRTIKEVLAQEYSVRNNKKVRKENKIQIDEEYPFMLGNIDRKVVGESSILMCKAENAFSIREWNGGKLPEGYILEAQHNMRVYKAEKCYIVSLICGKKFISREILRDEKVIDMIIKIEKDFWVNNILNKVPPKNEG